MHFAGKRKPVLIHRISAVTNGDQEGTIGRFKRPNGDGSFFVSQESERLK
jgi:hypothetical protein